jgi:putative aldouronate transport system permease protein
MVMYRSVSRRVFEIFLYVGFTVFCLAIIFPFLNVIAVSLSSRKALLAGKVYFWPVDLYTKGYQVILSSKLFLTSLRNTAGVLLINTPLQIGIALCAGYALSSRHFYGARVAFLYILIPMYFSGGLIPFYLMVNKYGLNNTYLALIFPYLTNTFYAIVFRNIISRLPKEIIESAEIDGATEFTILFRIVFALILPTAMAFAIFSAVDYWNMWFPVLIFIRKKSMWTLQYMLRDIYSNPGIGGGQLDAVIDDLNQLMPQNIINAAIMCTIIPIIVIYPFLQRYFIHGVIVGAVKG